MFVAKMVVGAYWLGVFWNFIFPFPAPVNSLMFYSALAIVGMHVLEIFVFSGVIRKASQNLPKDIVMIIFFGVIHISGMKKMMMITEQQEQQQSGS